MSAGDSMTSTRAQERATGERILSAAKVGGSSGVRQGAEAIGFSREEKKRMQAAAESLGHLDSFVPNRAQRRMHGAVARDQDAQRRYYAENREKVLAQDRARRAALKADPVAYRRRRAQQAQAKRDRDLQPYAGATGAVRQGPCVCGRSAVFHRKYSRATAVGTVLVLRGGAEADVHNGRLRAACPKYQESDK